MARVRALVLAPASASGGGGQHYCCTVVHCQGCKMEMRGRGIINDRAPFTVARLSRLYVHLFFLSFFFHSVAVRKLTSRELNPMTRETLNYQYERVKRG